MSASALFANPTYKHYQIEVFKFKQCAETYVQNSMDRIGTNFDFVGFNNLETQIQTLSNEVQVNLIHQMDSIKQSLISFDNSLTNKFLQPEQVQQQFISQ